MLCQSERHFKWNWTFVSINRWFRGLGLVPFTDIDLFQFTLIRLSYWWSFFRSKRINEFSPSKPGDRGEAKRRERERETERKRDVAGWLLSSWIRVHWHFGARAIRVLFCSQTRQRLQQHPTQRRLTTCNDDEENNEGEEGADEGENDDEEEDDDASARTCTVRAETWRSLASGFCLVRVSGISPRRVRKHRCIDIYIYMYSSLKIHAG